MRAVIFDLWETLIDWDRDAAARMLADVTALIDDEGFAGAMGPRALPLHDPDPHGAHRCRRSARSRWRRSARSGSSTSGGP